MELGVGLKVGIENDGGIVQLFGDVFLELFCLGSPLPFDIVARHVWEDFCAGSD